MRSKNTFLQFAIKTAIEFFIRQTQSMIRGRQGHLYLFFLGHHPQCIFNLYQAGKGAKQASGLPPQLSCFPAEVRTLAAGL
jgi:hypothetical protein